MDDEIQDVLNSSADFFANSSAETVAENEFPPPPIQYATNGRKYVLSPNSNTLLNDIVTESSNQLRICCPFCVFDFGFEYLLKEHIKICHPTELRLILNSKNDSVFYQCPFCDAKFFHKDLLPKHIMRKHEICVINMFSGFSPEKYMYCRFCPHKILRKHYKLLMIHIEKKHFQLFEKYVIEKYSNFTRRCDDLKNIDVNIQTDNSPGLSNQLIKLTTEDASGSSSQVKSILKPRTAYPIEATEEVDSIMLETEVNVIYANLEVKPILNKNARRKLRFDIPASDDEFDKENIYDTPTKKKKMNDGKSSKWYNILKSKKNCEIEDSADVSLLANYRCGICSESFLKNSKLIEHIKKSHKGLTLQAQYCCGDCDAKFYRNKFLRRHCKYHHSPLCLKSSFVKDNGKF